MLLLLSSATQAAEEWVDVQVTVPVYRDDLPAARQAGREEAIREVTASQGGHARLEERLVDGQLESSTLSFESEARIGRVVKSSEERLDAWLKLNFRVQLVSGPICQPSGASDYRKRIAITRFAWDGSHSARIGSLHDWDAQLAQTLASALRSSSHLVPFDGSQWQLYDRPATAPTQETAERALTQAIHVAESMGVQFVVSGVIRSLATEDPDAFRDTAWNRLMRVGQQSNLERQFVVDLFLHDGFSGALIYSRRYATTGRWNPDLQAGVSLQDSALLSTDYGKAVVQELYRMASDIQAQVACQPFMARIRRVEGRDVLFDSGAHLGFKPGDVLQVYRTRQLHDGLRYQGTELKEVQLALEVTQVQPDFSIGRLKVDPTRFNIQRDDLLVIW